MINFLGFPWTKKGKIQTRGNKLCLNNKRSKKINIFSYPLLFVIINLVTPLACVTSAALWNFSVVYILADRADKIYSEREAESLLGEAM